MARPDKLWETHEQIRRVLARSEGKLAAMADEAGPSSYEAAPGLRAEEVLALVWRETDLPTVPNGPPSSARFVWLLATDYHPLSVVFDRDGEWMRASQGRIVRLIVLLDGLKDRVRALQAAYGETRREDAPGTADGEEADRLERRRCVAEALLSGREGPFGRGLRVVDGGQSEFPEFQEPLPLEEPGLRRDAARESNLVGFFGKE